MPSNRLPLRFFTCNLKSLFYSVISYIFSFRGIPVSIGEARLNLPPLHFRVYPPTYEELNLHTLMRIKFPHDSTAIDVGAHYGIYSIVLAKYLKLRVFAIEPTPYSFSVLLQTICMNSLQRLITPIRAAVSNKDGVSPFNIQQENGSVANSLVDYHHSEEPKYTSFVNVVKIDSIAYSTPVSFIKIDAEGVELDVLSGALDTISKYKPIILLGLHPAALSAIGYSLKDVQEFIKRLGYETLSYSSPGISHSNFLLQKSVFDIFIAPIKQQ